MGKASASYLYAVPRTVLVHLLRSESREAGYSDPAVRVSLLLDVDADRAKSQREYAQLWGWSHKKVRANWPSIVEDVTDWATSGGRQKSSEIARRLFAYLDAQEALSQALKRRLGAGAQEGHSEGTGWGTENARDDPKNADEGHSEGTEKAQHTNQPSSPPTSSLREDTPEARPRVRGPDGASKARPESLDACRAYFAEQGRQDLADAFFDHFTSNGWRVSGRTPMQDWQASARNWIRNDERYGRSSQTPQRRPAGATNGHAGRRSGSGPGDDPASDYERNRRAALEAVGLG